MRSQLLPSLTSNYLVVVVTAIDNDNNDMVDYVAATKFHTEVITQTLYNAMALLVLSGYLYALVVAPSPFFLS